MHVFVHDFCLRRTWEYIRTGTHICVPHIKASRNMWNRYEVFHRQLFYCFGFKLMLNFSELDCGVVKGMIG
jgi:hypothetical protein